MVDHGLQQLGGEQNGLAVKVASLSYILLYIDNVLHAKEAA